MSKTKKRRKRKNPAGWSGGACGLCLLEATRYGTPAETGVVVIIVVVIIIRAASLARERSGGAMG